MSSWLTISSNVRRFGHRVVNSFVSVTVKSSQLGPDNCSATVSIDQPLSQPVTVYVPSGTVCLECIIGGVLATNATFQILNSPVSPSEGTVVNGTLVVSGGSRGVPRVPRNPPFLIYNSILL